MGLKNLLTILVMERKTKDYLVDGEGFPYLLNLDGKDSITIGREGILKVSDDYRPLKVSRIHAEFTKKNGVWYITDCESRYGTLINGKKIAPKEPHRLSVGNIVTLGEYPVYLTEVPMGPIDSLIEGWKERRSRKKVQTKKPEAVPPAAEVVREKNTIALPPEDDMISRNPDEIHAAKEQLRYPPPSM
jgi:pSer/pThr/pTyr-binding forkhead associated (FHA) protein